MNMKSKSPLKMLLVASATCFALIPLQGLAVEESQATPPAETPSVEASQVTPTETPSKEEKLLEFEFLQFARGGLLTCLHPTADSKDAESYYVEQPIVEGDIAKSTIKTSYSGWMFSNEYTAVIRVNNEKKINVTILNDTNRTGRRECKYEKGWEY